MALKKVHRDTDDRVCGATTNATEHKVFANGKEIAVNGDTNSHGGGALTASSKNVFCGSKKVVIHKPDSAAPDSLCPLTPHCNPATDEGSGNVFAGEG